MDITEVGEQEARVAGVVKFGSQVFAVTAEQSLKIETSPQGSEVLDVECPAGKAWSVKCDVTITEVDA